MKIDYIIKIFIAIFLLWAAFKTLVKEQRWEIFRKKEWTIKEWLIIAGSIIMFVCGLVLLIYSVTKLF